MSGERLLTWYGDDLTGSTDVMEAMALAGVPTVLFLGIPDEAMRARFDACRAIGLAGTARSQSPAWMDHALPGAFGWLASLGGAVCHYKVCSTFDSSPTIGNIGRAIEIGRTAFRQSCVPLVVGAPQLRRYTAFGTLFAAYQGQVYRIDRHPVMSRHPVTPMDEADLLRHLARQTDLPSALVDRTGWGQGMDAVDRAVAAGAAILLLDVDDLASQRLAGAALAHMARPGGLFVAGSSGVEYALLAEWRVRGILGEPAAFQPPAPVERLAVVSGSCSPTTERQIRHALAAGFVGLSLDPLALIDSGEAGVQQAVSDGLAHLEQGRSVILYTALGGEGDRTGAINARPGARDALGRQLGAILRDLVREADLPRAVIAGGDTSSHALGELGVEALTVRMPLPATPGSPLCRAHGRKPGIEGLEIALKGGQIGADAYFVAMREGTL